MKQTEVKAVVKKMVDAGESATTIERFIKEAAKRNSLGKKKNSTTSATVESPLAQRISDLPSENTSSDIPENGSYIYPFSNVSLHDMIEFDTDDVKVIKEEKKKKKVKEEIVREKFNKQIKIEDQVENGNITKEEGEAKINSLNKTYTPGINDRSILYFNQNIEKINSSDLSEADKEAKLETVVHKKEKYTTNKNKISKNNALLKELNDIPYNFNTSLYGIERKERVNEKKFVTVEGIVDPKTGELVRFYNMDQINTRKKQLQLQVDILESENKNAFHDGKLAFKSDVVVSTLDMNLDGTIDAFENDTYNTELDHKEKSTMLFDDNIIPDEDEDDSEDGSGQAINLLDNNVTYSTDEQLRLVNVGPSFDIETSKDNKLLEDILKSFYIKNHAEENNITYEEAAKSYDFSEDDLSWNSLSNGSFSPEDIEKIKKYWVDERTKRKTRQSTQINLSDRYRESTGFFAGGGRRLKGGTEDQFDEKSQTIQTQQFVNEKIKEVDHNVSILSGLTDRNVVKHDALLEEIESIPLGTITVNGKIYKDENGEDIKLPNATDIQLLINRNKELSQGNYTTQETADAANEEIKANEAKISEYIQNYQGKINTLNLYKKNINNYTDQLHEQFKHSDGLADTADDYVALMEIQNHTFGGLYRISESFVIDGVGGLLASVDEIALEFKDLTGWDNLTPGRKGILFDKHRDALDEIRDESSQRRSTTFSYSMGYTSVGQHALEMTAGMGPMLIATVLSGGTAGLVVAGTQATGGDLERTRKLKEFSPDLYDFSRGERYLSAFIHGASEVITERLLVKQVGRVSSALTKTPGFSQGVSSYLTGMLNIGTRMAVESLQEGFGEGLNAFVGNVSDRFVLGMEVNLMDNVSSAFVDGMLVSGVIGSPVIFKHTTNHLIPNKLEKTLANNADRILEVNRMLENTDLSEDVRKDLETELLELVDANITLQDNHLKGSLNYSKEDKQELIDISNKKYNLKKKARNIDKDKSLTKKQREDEIKKAEDAYNELDARKEEIINKDTRTDEEKLEDYKNYVTKVKDKVDAYNERNPDKPINVEELTTEQIEAQFNFGKKESTLYYQAELDSAQDQLDNNIDKQRYLLDSKGNRTGENPNYNKKLTPERKAQLQDIVDQATELIEESKQQSKSDATQFGFIDENLNIFINKETSLAKGGRITTAAHEFLHAVLFKTIGRDANIQARLGGALTKFLDKKGGVSQEFLNRMQPYLGEANMGEEMITVMSESIMDGTLKFDEGFFTQVGDILRRFLQKTFPNKFGKIKFNTGRDVYNFIKDYNDSIEKGYTNKAIDNVMDKGAEGRLVSGPKKSGPGISYSKANNLQQMYETTYKGDKVKLVEEGLSIDKDGNKVKDTELYKSILGEGMGKIAGRITKRLFDPIPLSQRAGITHEIYMNEVLKLGGQIIRDEYDPTRQSLDRFVSNRLNNRAESLAKKIGVKQEFTEDISDPKVGNQLKVDPVDFDAPKYETIDGKPTVADKLVKVDPELQPVMDEMRTNIDNGLEMLLSNEGMLLELKDPNLDPQIKNSYEQQIEANNAELEILGMKDFDITKQNYKSLKDLNPEITQKMFGIIPKPGVLKTKGDIPNAQRFIDTHADILAGALPQGFVASTSKSTGVQKVLLDEFYNKRSIRAGTAAGEFVQYKKPMPAIMKTFRSLFGITERGQRNLAKKETNVSSRIKAIVAQTGKVISNQMVREYLEKSGHVDARIMIAISEGKSDLQFSKGKTLNKIAQENPEKGAAISIALFDTTVDKMKKYNGNMKNFANDQLIPLVDDKVLTMKEIEKIGEDLQDMHDLIMPSYIAPETMPLEVFVVDKYFSTIEGRVGYASMLSDMTGEKFVKVKGNKLAQEQGRVGLKTLANKLDAKYGPGFSAKYMMDFVKSGAKIQDGENIPVEPGSIKLKKNPNWTPYKTWKQEDIDKLTPKEKKKLGTLIAGVTPKLNSKEKTSPQDNRLGFAANTVDAAFLTNTPVIDGKVVYDYGKHGAYPDGFSAYMKGNLDTVPTAKQRAAFIKAQTQNNAAYRKINDMIRELYQDKIITGNQVISILANMNANQKGLTRASAILDFIPAENKNYKGDKLVLEHMTPALAINLFALRHILSSNDTVVQARKDLHDALDNYRLAYLPKSYDDIVNKFYKSTMPFYWSPTSTSLIRYYNAEMAGAFDLQMTQLSTGIVVGPELATDKKLMDQVVKGQLKAVSEVLKVEVTEKQLEGYYFSKASKIAKDALMTSNTVNPEKGISIWDFDDTLAQSKSNVLYTAPDGTTGKLTAEEFAKQGADLLAKGYVYDFSEFSQVVEGTPGPLFQEFVDRIKKFGVKDNFILTARPENSAPAIQAFLSEFGLNIPIENITGLANSTPESKALWITEKVAEGYNNIYFADDALANVQVVRNVLDQFDIKSDVVQAKIQFSKQISPEFNNILDNNVAPELDLNRIIEQSAGVKAEAEFSQAQAKIRGSKKGKFSFFVPPSAEDFRGLIYRFLAKGRIGEQQMAFFKKALFDPFAKGYTSLNKSKQSLNAGYRTLLKNFPTVKKELNSKLDAYEGFKGNQFTVDQAIRVYLWNKNNIDIPGLSKRDSKTLVDFVEGDTAMKTFADSLQQLVAQEQGYVTPNDYWLVESTSSDIQSINNEISRQEHLSEFIQNRGIMFGEWQGTQLVGPNMNKMEAIYGSNFRDALEDILYRMEYGSKREGGKNRLVNMFNNWANQSVGAIMFFNMRSALLQTISSVNYINWSDNNPLKAAAAFANQKQFWSDFSMIYNSDMLKLRRAGNQRGINEAELAQAVAGSKNKAKAALNWLLTKGFLPTQIADSFAIASGGATFYRNRVKSLMKQGLTQQEAEARAMQDFQEVTEESQQSSRPDLISQQQASPLGRYILAFKNTPMQYARLMKKSVVDLAKGRGDAKTHISKIIYYGLVQNLIFNGLQAALGALVGDDDEEKEAETKTRIINGMVDSVLSGLGFGGNVVMTVKNTLMEYLKQRERGWSADHTYTILKIIGLSPTVGSKLRKIYSGIQTEKFNREVINEMSYFDIENPMYEAIANVISGATNLPLDRLIKKVNNVDAAITEDISAIERLALLMGWNTWDLGIEDQDIIAVENEIKERKQIEKKEKQKIKKEEKKIKVKEENKIKEETNKKLQEEEIKEGKEVTCIAISKSGKRCKTKIEEGSSYCTVHQKVEQGNKEVQCSQIKSNGKRCKMNTKAKSGLCYYHD